MDQSSERIAMTERLSHQGINDARVLRSMATVPRERFLPSSERSHAYEGGPQPIGEGQTMSAPWIVAFQVQAMQLPDHARVLEVGTGSGYAAAVLAACGATVVTVERHAALAERAREALAGYDVEVRVGDGHLGAPDRAPFDGIVVTAMADAELPPELVDQLAPGAALVCPVGGQGGGELLRHRDGRVERLVDVQFVPLVRDEHPGRGGRTRTDRG
ncbi:MAG: protein-L-isoaspartate O-methyltransferase [Pseudonocardia sp.]|nr:protein-L-isoaspartate O-methyltransferase [Pseudonocardia sp.]